MCHLQLFDWKLSLYHLGLLCILFHTNANDELDDIILQSMIPSISTKCKRNSENLSDQISHYTFDHSVSPSYWDPIASPFEEDLFLAEMSNTNNGNQNKSWTLRVGQGGNIYSFRGAYGEAIPPQFHVEGQWVDEVLQSVSVNRPDNNDPDNPYFMHQSGAYMKDDAFTEDNPFFSPSLLKYCRENECSFGSWGQQAHLPTIHKSNMLYFNAYRDCGDGIIEFTSVFHNADTDLVNGKQVDYLNVPWGGARYSTLRDFFLSRPDGTLDVQFNMEHWLTELLRNHEDTGGFTTFAEQVEVSEKVYNAKNFQMPSDSDGETLRLIIAEDNQTRKSNSHSETHNLYCMRVTLKPTIFNVAGCQRKCNLWLTNSRTGDRIVTTLVLHWAWQNNEMYFCTDGNITETEFNNMFKKDDEILVSYANYGKPFEDNLAFTYVHGTYDAPLDQRFNKKRVRYGNAGSVRRDYNAYTTNAFINIYPGDTYVYQQFLLTGQLSEVEELAASWKDEIYEDLFPQGEMPVSDIHLYSIDASAFGASVGNSTTCSSMKGGESRCVGTSAPALGYLPLYAISCGNQHYVGSDLYHFSPSRASDTDVIRSYACDLEEIQVRPKWKLLGFFMEGNCDYLKNAVYDDAFCDNSDELLEDNDNNESSPSPSPTNFSTTSPSNFFSDFPTDNTTNDGFIDAIRIFVSDFVSAYGSAIEETIENLIPNITVNC